MEDRTDNTSNFRRCGQIGEGEEDTITMEDALKEEDRLKEEASAVLGASDPVNCSRSKGYIDRQAVYACATCTPNGNAGVCLACSNVCHEGHDLYELYTKRYFCCDCGNDKFPGKECKLEKNKGGMNSRNRYNHNFTGLYCTCRRPYPDHDDDLEDEMIQCIMCEDWFHGRHLNTSAPDEFVEMICHECMSKYPFLWAYNLELSYEATKDTKPDLNEMIDVVSSDQNIQVEGRGNCTTDNNGNCSTDHRQELSSEDSKDFKIQNSKPLPGTTEPGPVDSTNAASSTQSGSAQTESSAMKRSSSSPSEESESLPKKIKLEPGTEHDQCRNNEKGSCFLKSLEQRTSEFREHATFWPMGWRSKLCKCDECMNMYRDREIEFLTDESDTVQAYEERGNSVQHANMEEENEADMFAGLDRVAQIEVARGMQDLKSELAVFLQGFAREGKVVRETDIREFFEQMEQKRRRRLNIPQHNCR